MVVEINNTTTLGDVVENYEDVIAMANADYCYRYDLGKFFGDYVGDDNLSEVLAHPDAFKAFAENNLISWNLLLLDTPSNISRLISAGYSREEVLEVVARDLYEGSALTGESPKFYNDLFNNYDTRTVRQCIHNYHPNIPGKYLTDIMNIIYNLCLESLEINRQ